MLEMEQLYCECGNPLRFVYIEMYAEGMEVNISCECSVCGKRYIKSLEGLKSENATD